MKEIKVKNHKIEIYDDIKEMPAYRYNMYQKAMVFTSGIGNTLGDIVSKINNIRAMVGNKKCERQMNSELLALMQTFHFIDGGIDPRGLAFAAVVSRIDGEEVSIVTNDDLQALSERLTRMMTRGELENALDGIKKKLRMTWRRIFRRSTATGEATRVRR